MSFPLLISVRDTELYDDMGGGGQRIYTTAGQGYTKQRYVRVDAFYAASIIIAKRIAAHKIGSRDPTGKNLPDYIWRQAMSDAHKELMEQMQRIEST